MNRTFEEPIETPDGGVLKTKTTHPAFAQISASRVTGQTFLHGSDFSHNHFISIRIKRSELHRDLGRDWNFGREEYIEVWLSESQWATFVSSMNCGDGTPCTLRYRNGEYVPEITIPKNRKEQFSVENAETVEKAKLLIGSIQSALAESKLSKPEKAKLQSLAIQAQNAVSAASGFLAQSFAEHMEATTEKAKMEVNAYATAAIHRLARSNLPEIENVPILTLDLNP